ncbi:hypothetical protein SAMN05443144_12164 [Fodinibius roseus]|uniref:Uncharacterized protein n=1 Tax=Fodinibius roseus TaxID=1194090 RepID=A0A1M5HY91_9BACT|nr:hypothetical protein [Fodinibius roseus]SHG20852.1 hypothetical protein SAMN05443144_12164 [Fodinibius roseus]
MKKTNTTNADPFAHTLLSEFYMITDWLIRLSQAIGNTTDHELQKVLRFNRWYLGRELDNIVRRLEDNDIEYPFCSYLTALYAGNQSEIRELERALNGKGKAWYVSGKLLSPKEIKQRLKEVRLSKDRVAQELCPECRKEALVNY